MLVCEDEFSLFDAAVLTHKCFFILSCMMHENRARSQQRPEARKKSGRNTCVFACVCVFVCLFQYEQKKCDYVSLFLTTQHSHRYYSHFTADFVIHCLVLIKSGGSSWPLCISRLSPSQVRDLPRVWSLPKPCRKE